MLDAFRAVNREFHVTIIMVTHDLVAARRADRRIRVRDGRVLHEGVPVDPVSDDGRVRLPDEAVAALGGVDLEAEVTAGRGAPAAAERDRPCLSPTSSSKGSTSSAATPGAQGVVAVRGASVAVRPRDFVALMGPSGSGKTTFLGVLAGLDPPDEGEVRWKGRPMGSLSARSAARSANTGSASCSRASDLLPALSAVENVELPLRVNGVDLDGGARARRRMARSGSAWRRGCTTGPSSCRPGSSNASPWHVR